MSRRNRKFFFDNIRGKLIKNTTNTVADNANEGLKVADFASSEVLHSTDSFSDVDTKFLTAAATDDRIVVRTNELVDSAPETLNTLNELAAALGDDANFSTTTSTALGNRLRIDVNNQSLTTTQKSNAVTNLGLATVATSGAYSDLTGTPTIPTNNNELTNGAGYITGYTVTESDVTGHQAALSITESQISDLGSYLTGITSSQVTTALGYTPGTSSFSGSYNDLTNKPTIPTNNNQLTNGAGYITSADGGNADTVDGLHVHTGTNNEANKIVRTQGNGYIHAGWINTTSGSAGTTAPDRIYGSYDGYIRYYTPDSFKSVMASRFIINDSTQANSIWIRNASPTIYFRDTNHRGAMLHNNSNLFYVLRGSQATDSTSWATVNGRWPLTINLGNNDATFGGNVTAYSDVRLKENIEPIGITIDQFKSIEAKRFDWKDDGKHDVGFIAQDVEAAGLVEVVKEHEEREPETGELIDTYKTLDYSRMIPFLWDIVQKQQKEIEELKEMIGGASK